MARELRRQDDCIGNMEFRSRFGNHASCIMMRCGVRNLGNREISLYKVLGMGIEERIHDGLKLCGREEPRRTVSSDIYQYISTHPRCVVNMRYYSRSSERVRYCCYVTGTAYRGNPRPIDLNVTLLVCSCRPRCLTFQGRNFARGVKRSVHSLAMFQHVRG